MSGVEERSVAGPGMPPLDALTSPAQYMAAVKQCFRESGLTYRAVVKRLEAHRARGGESYQTRRENTFQDLVAKGAMPRTWINDQGLGTLPQLLLALGYSPAQREQWKKAWARIATGAPSPATARPPHPTPTPALVAPARPRRRALAAAALLVFASAGASGTLLSHGGPAFAAHGPDPQEWSWQTPDTKGLDGQCIGITDGRSAFRSTNPTILGLLAAIHQQNTIALTPSHIDVVLTVTLTDPGTRCLPDDVPNPIAGGPGCDQDSGTAILPDRSISSSEDVTAAYTELRGALMAQCQYNRVAGHNPKLRILIANAASSYRYAGQLAQSEVDLADQDPQFAAVLGLYQSSQETFNAEQILNDHLIPVLSAASADPIPVSPDDERRPLDDLVRLAPPNTRETGQIVTFLANDLHKSHPCLIGPTGGTDDFTTNWTDDLREHGKGQYGWDIPVTAYDANSPTDDVGTQLSSNPGACGAPNAAHTYDAIVFAGRAQDLQYVLPKLRTWGYPSTIPVIGGDDLSNLAANPTPVTTGDTDNRTIYFADFAPPTPAQPGSPYYFEPFADSYRQVLGPHNTATGHLYAAFDAAWLLAQSAAAVNTSSDGIKVGGQIMRENISQKIRTTCGQQAIQGATGMISLDAHGDPMQQPITINSIDANGTPLPIAYTDGLPTKSALEHAMGANDDLTCLAPQHADQRPTRPAI